MRLRRGGGVHIYRSLCLSFFGHSFATFGLCSDLDVRQRFSIKDLFVFIISIM